MPAGSRRDAAGAIAVAAVALVPFARGLLSGRAFYFRDLSLHFFPLRRFALEGLRAGELRLWNPYVHEGIPLALPALGYPPDLLQLLRPDAAGLSLTLALHVPLAALALAALARGLGLSRTAAAAGGLVYALGGFLLSTLNLYVYLQAAAWAPLVVLAFLRLAGATPTRRGLAAAAGALALGLSTAGVEIVGQALIAGVVLGLRAPPRRALRPLARVLAACGLAAAAAAPVLVLLAGQLAGSARGRGFPTAVMLAHSVHPFTLVQVLVAGLYGNVANLAAEWWGQNFFPRGFPYLTSLYLGAAALALAAAGLFSGHRLRTQLGLLALAGLAVSLGQFAGWAPLVEALPSLRVLRFPVKAFFTVHLAVALLAALGVDALGRGARGAWRATTATATILGTLLAALPLVPALWPAPLQAFARAFLPPDFGPVARAAILRSVLADAATGGAVALAVAGLGVLAQRGRLAAPRAAALVTALVVADLLRAGAGLNPMVTAAFYEPSPELAARLGGWRAGRVFTCPVEESVAYRAARLALPGAHEALSFGALSETLSPSFNVPLAVPTALSPDLTMLVPEERTLAAGDGSCRQLATLLPRLRAAGVRTVLSLDPLVDRDLADDGVLAPARIAPLRVHAYALRESAPLVELRGAPGSAGLVARGPGHATVDVMSAAPALLVVSEGAAPGWRARYAGREAEIVAVDGRRLGVRVPAGRGRVDLSYRPRALGPALGLALVALVGLGVLAWGRGATRPA